MKSTTAKAGLALRAKWNAADANAVPAGGGDDEKHRNCGFEGHRRHGPHGREVRGQPEARPVGDSGGATGDRVEKRGVVLGHGRGQVGDEQDDPGRGEPGGDGLHRNGSTPRHADQQSGIDAGDHRPVVGAIRHPRHVVGDLGGCQDREPAPARPEDHENGRPDGCDVPWGVEPRRRGSRQVNDVGHGPHPHEEDRDAARGLTVLGRRAHPRLLVQGLGHRANPRKPLLVRRSSERAILLLRTATPAPGH